MNYGATYGATIVDQFSEEAEEHAKRMYPEIRARTTDVEKISRNTGYTEEQVRKVKNYLFIDKHFIEGTYKHFDESFAIAQSWDRLTIGKFAYHDFLLLEHELLELELVEAGYPQEVAHDKINPIADYGTASNDFYERLKNSKVSILIKEDEERYIYGKNEEYYRER